MDRQANTDAKEVELIIQISKHRGLEVGAPVISSPNQVEMEQAIL